MGPRSLSVTSDNSSNPISPSAATQRATLKAKGKALATTLMPSSRNASQTDLAPREVTLPYDPFVNGQPIEVFLYKEPQECPICFLEYPPYLNRTRCCDQPICSECFVQIKRPDPHFPEHHGEGEDGQPAQAAVIDTQLISEPATCPYCQAPDFGATYEPPPYRRGLIHAGFPLSGGSVNASSSSVNVATTSCSMAVNSRRRGQSLASNAPGVITTDMVRPDWKAKLEAMRAHQQRRAAAATALHTATYLMGSNPEVRSLFGRPSRLSRRQTGSLAAGGQTAEIATGPVPPNPSSVLGPTQEYPGSRSSAIRSSLFNGRQCIDLEDLLLAEAMRLSLADEEERKKRMEKEAKKEAKKKEKDAKKAGGHSATSNLDLEPGFANAAQLELTAGSSTQDKGKEVDRPSDAADSSPSRDDATSSPPPSSTGPALPIKMGSTHECAPSHLRKMSIASSVSSFNVDSAPGSFSGPGMPNPRSSALSVEDEGDRDGGNTANEPMFNFNSLAEMVGVQIDGRDAGRSTRQESDDKESESQLSPDAVNEGVLTSQQEDAVRKPDSNEEGSESLTDVTATRTNPGADDHGGNSKRLGGEGSVMSRQVEVTH